MRPPFPFSAIVGQEALKKALVLCVIDPHLGGVLIRGAKGVAKSTAVRALAALLPPIESVAGCPFNRMPGQPIADWPLAADAQAVRKPVPLVELPLGATEDRVLGSIHFERAIQTGRREFDAGLLAAANRGILYVDEVNLLPDHLVDVLLDAAASGVHRLEREGISLTHPAQFTLIGTMNPEEGELRPQLLDRFGLVVDVSDLEGPEQRAEAVRRRLEYDHDSEQFAQAWQSLERAEAKRIEGARQSLPNVTIAGELLDVISRRCVEAGAEGLRADLTIARAALAWAAHEGRLEVGEADVRAVEEMALAHRRTRRPDPPPDGRNGQREPTNGGGQEPGSQPPPAQGARVFDIAAGPVVIPLRFRSNDGSRAASRVAGSGPRRIHKAGRTAQRVRLRPTPVLSLTATLRAAAPLQNHREHTHGSLRIQAEDLRWRWRERRPRRLVLFLIDSSGSMASRRRMRQTKAAVWALALDVLCRGDRVLLLSFQDQSARELLSPSRSRACLRAALEQLPVGGATPLALGLSAAGDRAVRWAKQARVQLVVLTDGRANASKQKGDPWQSALSAARRLRRMRLPTLVIDTETGLCRLALARLLSCEMGADYIVLDDLLQSARRGSYGLDGRCPVEGAAS